MATRNTKQAHRLQHGRHVKAPPKPTARAALKARVERREADANATRRDMTDRARLQAAEDDQRHARKCRDIVMLRAGPAGLDGVAVTKLANTVEAKRQAHIRAGKAPFSYDVYGVVADKLAQLGYGVRVPRSDPLDATRALPPPQGEGHAPPPGTLSTDDEIERAEMAGRTEDRARRLVERNRRDREAYREALARHGFLDPTVGYPSGSGSSGFGL